MKVNLSRRGFLALAGSAAAAPLLPALPAAPVPAQAVPPAAAAVRTIKSFATWGYGVVSDGDLLGLVGGEEVIREMGFATQADAMAAALKNGGGVYRITLCKPMEIDFTNSACFLADWLAEDNGRSGDLSPATREKDWIRFRTDLIRHLLDEMIERNEEVWWEGDTDRFWKVAGGIPDEAKDRLARSILDLAIRTMEEAGHKKAARLLEDEFSIHRIPEEELNAAYSRLCRWEFEDKAGTLIEEWCLEHDLHGTPTMFETVQEIKVGIPDAESASPIRTLPTPSSVADGWPSAADAARLLEGSEDAETPPALPRPEEKQIAMPIEAGAEEEAPVPRGP